MTQNQFDEVVNRISNRITLVEKKFIQKVAKQIKQIGELNPSSINRLAVMLEMNKDIAEITSDLLIATGLNISDMQAIYEKAASDVYTDKRFQRAIESIESAPEAPKSPKVGKERLKHYANSVARQTAEIMANLSNTTIVSQTYRDAVDNAIIAASTGMGSYQEEMRDIVKDLGKNGIQVRYPSGYKRRLDTAVRQNITDGVKQIAQNGSLLMGEELGYDAVEISAHMKSAPDHEPVQGRILKLEEFHKMQDGQPFCDVNGKLYEAFKRRIGEWNCYHIVMSFSTKWSVPRYSEEQLQRWAEDNNAGCFIGGRHYTIYEATQLMRKLETKSRWLKNEAIAAKAAGDEELRHDLQRKINQVSQQYAAVAAASEQPMKKSRMQVQGFRAVKTVEKPLTSGADGGIDYMSRFNPTFSDEKVLTVGDLSIRTKIVSNSKFKMFTNIDADRKDKAVRLTEKNLIAVQKSLPESFEMPPIAVVNFDKHKLNTYAIGGYDKSTGIMYINSKYDTKEKILAYVNQTKGQFANTTEYAPILHELGHKFYEDCIKRLAISENMSYNESKKMIDRRIYGYIENKHDPDFVMNTISGYASDGESSGMFTEIIAECFSVIGKNAAADEILALLE